MHWGPYGVVQGIPFLCWFSQGCCYPRPCYDWLLVSDPPTVNPGWLCQPTHPGYRGSTDMQTCRPSTEMLIGLEAPNQ